MKTERLIEYWCKLMNTKLNKKSSWYQREKHYQKIDRVEYLITVSYFLYLRQKIKTEVQQNYNNLDYKFNIITYDDYGFYELDCVNLQQHILQPLIDEYIKRVTKEIESNSLKLEL